MSKKSSYNVNDVANYLTEAPDFINLYISDLEKQISNLSNIGLAPIFDKFDICFSRSDI